MYCLIFFTNILRLLSERKITKYQLATRANISVSYLSELTNGRANPSLKTMEALAQALDEPLPALLETVDLNKHDIRLLAEGLPIHFLPEGYKRVSAVLNEFQAFTVEQWDEVNRKFISQTPKP